MNQLPVARERAARCGGRSAQLEERRLRTAMSRPSVTSRCPLPSKGTMYNVKRDDG